MADREREYDGVGGIYLWRVCIIFCTTDDNDFVEFALSGRLSATLMWKYTLKLIDKTLL